MGITDVVEIETHDNGKNGKLGVDNHELNYTILNGEPELTYVGLRTPNKYSGISEQEAIKIAQMYVADVISPAYVPY